MGNPILTQVNISSVNPAKCVVIIGNSYLNNPYDRTLGAYLVSILSTSMGFYGNATATNIGFPFSWQLIEFL